jgi:hypothetical protein
LLVAPAAALEVAPQAFLERPVLLQMLQQAVAAAVASMRLLPKTGAQTGLM